MNEDTVDAPVALNTPAIMDLQRLVFEAIDAQRLGREKGGAA